MQLDIVIRAAGSTTLLLTALILIWSAPRSAVARWFVPFALGVAGFLGVNTAYDAADLGGPLWSIASFFSRMAALFLWLFCLALFDGRLRSPILALGVAGLWLTLVVIDKGYIAPAPSWITISPMLLLLGTGLVLHAGWRAIRDLRDDLVEPRRRARPFFALALLGILALDLVVDMVQGYGWRPASFLTLQNGAISLLAVGLALWLLRANAWLRVETQATAGTTERVAVQEADTDRAILDKLEALMRTDRLYLDPGLTVAQFASRAGVPEPSLRRAINHGLGHGHFRNFLNEYRVREAKRRLQDPALANDKIIAVALDSGFSSVASFNRAFRQIAGCTPSEFRARSGRGAAEG